MCLGLMVDGKVQVGALVCPNLPVDPEEPEGKKGILLSAVRGEGATMVCLFVCLEYLTGSLHGGSSCAELFSRVTETIVHPICSGGSHLYEFYHRFFKG